MVWLVDWVAVTLPGTGTVTLEVRGAAFAVVLVVAVVISFSVVFDVWTLAATASDVLATSVVVF